MTDPTLLTVLAASLGLMVLIVITLLISQQWQARRRSVQLNQLTHLLEQSLLPNAASTLTIPQLDKELAVLIPPISELLAKRLDRNHDRYEVLKELARGLNHNMNNRLFGILGATQLIERHSDNTEIQSWAKVAHTDGQKLTELVKQLTDAVTDHVDQTPEDLSLNDIVSTLLNTHQPRWLEQAITADRRISFQIELADHCALIRANSGGIANMLKQLIQNSVDALVDGGTVTIRTFQPTPLEVSIEVSDNGVGMDGATRRRIFDPFFTTKKTLGTGLGLAKVMTTVLQWDGAIAVTSEAGNGASFVITFPTVYPSDTTQTGENHTTRHARVLVVDDQSAIGEVISMALAENFEVTVFEDSEAAIRAFKPGQWAVAIIDLDLPGMPGDQLARRIREHDPDIIRILMTGWVLDAADPRLNDFEYYLQKPVTDINQLNKLVSDALRYPKGLSAQQ